MSKEDRVLVVARSPQSMMQMQELLRAKYRMETALTWEGAADMVDDFDPHIVIVDQDQDPFKSFEFAQKTKEQWLENSYLAVILIYQHNNGQYQDLLTRSRADLILNPDFTDQELQTAVSILLKLKKKEDEIIGLYRKLSVTQGMVKELQTVDSITKLYNLPTITKLLDESFRKARRFDEPISVLLISIDHFIQFSHKQGPLFCMKLIQQLSDVLTEQVRDEDLLGRGWGGEFIAVLPETDLEGATLVASRIRDKVQVADFGTKDERVHLSISQGIASYNPFKSVPQTSEQMLLIAEDLLSKAKQADLGRIGTLKQVI
ncbi:MAG: GGDEF domain-containing protein [Oligoflexus sp.]